MSTQETGSVIHRKARHAREGLDARAMSPSKALRLALEHGGNRLFDLALTVCAVEQRSLAQAELRDEAGPDRLIVLIEGQDGVHGAALFDRPFVQALVEVQTTGRVRPGEPPERAFTNTDAAVAAPLLDAMLEGFDDRMEEVRAQYRRAGFRFGDRIADGRGLSLALEAPEYELFRITADIGAGTRTGVLTVILPGAALSPSRPAAPAGTGRARFDLSDLAMSAPVALDAVLERLTLPLAEVMRLQPGMTLPVAAASIGQTELVAARGHVAAVVRLGQMNGFRAVRLGPPDEAGAEAGAERTAPDPVPGPGPEADMQEIPREPATDAPEEGAPPDPDLPAEGQADPPELADLSAGPDDDPPGLPDLPA